MRKNIQYEARSLKDIEIVIKFLWASKRPLVLSADLNGYENQLDREYLKLLGQLATSCLVVRNEYTMS